MCSVAVFLCFGFIVLLKKDNHDNERAIITPHENELSSVCKNGPAFLLPRLKEGSLESKNKSCFGK